MLAVFAACKKENRMIAISKYVSTGNINATVMMSTPENPLNPYDSLGYWHNRIVNYILDCKENTVPDANVSTQCVLQFYKQLYDMDLPASSFTTVSRTVDESNADIQNVITGCSYDEIVKLKLESLIQMIHKLSDNKSTYPVIKTAITGFENGVMQDKLLSAEDSEAILKVTSIARFSIYYWMDVFHAAEQGDAFFLKNVVKWIAATTSDIGGAIVSGNDVAYAADCSAYAYDLITYSMP